MLPKVDQHDLTLALASCKRTLTNACGFDSCATVEACNSDYDELTSGGK